MRPLIGKVKVGDILKGTRNLRNYLRTVSLLQHLEAIRAGLGRNNVPKLYTPSKEDNFVVGMNAWGGFGVWCAREDLVILWFNPISVILKKKQSELRMSPSLFAHWFIRTQDRNPDLKEWPIYAYNLRSYLHLNGIENNLQSQFVNDKSSNRYNPFLGRYNPFRVHQELTNIGDRYHIKKYTLHVIKRGKTRLNIGGNTILSLETQGNGPRIRDIKKMKFRIREYLSEPRFRNKITKSWIDNFDLKKYM